MRVALVCPYSVSVFGGVQTQVEGLAVALRESGSDVRLIAPVDGSPEADWVVPIGRSIGVRANGSVAPISPLPPAWIRTLRSIRDADVVHVHEPFVPGPALATVLQSRVPVVGTFHQSGYEWPYRLAGPIIRLLGRRIAAPVAVSEAAAAMVRGPLGREVRVLWNGVRGPRKPDPWPSDVPAIAFVGRHEQRKGLGVLLDALPHLDRDVRVWIMGEGPLTPALKTTHARDSRVEWLGRVDDRERDRRLAGAAVYCAPNLGGESFGVVLAEAMAAGTAVVASDIQAFRAVGREERGEALFVPPGDPLALAGALRKLLGDDDLRQRMAAAGRARAAELSMDRLAERYLDIYGEVLRGATAPGSA